jgi:phosphoribosyl 1,2-cyclic phosphodiesterase
MRVRFWGVRGSIACPGADTIRYGGNTPCIEVRCGDHVLVKNTVRRDVDIFLTHCHLDHVTGLPFFAPFFIDGYKVGIWAGNLLPDGSVEQVMRKIMSSPLFPVEVEIFRSGITYNDFVSGDVLKPYPGVTLHTAPLDHPDGASGYRLEYNGKVFALISDTSGFPGKRDRELVALARNADLIVYDATFTEEEIKTRETWGHSTWERGVKLADEAGARQLCLFHHDPSHDDDFMDALAADAADARPGTLAAREGQIIDL